MGNMREALMEQEERDINESLKIELLEHWSMRVVPKEELIEGISTKGIEGSLITISVHAPDGTALYTVMMDPKSELFYFSHNTQVSKEMMARIMRICLEYQSGKIDPEIESNASWALMEKEEIEDGVLIAGIISLEDMWGLLS